MVFSSGNNVVQTGGYLVLQDVSLVNNGTFNTAAGSVRFSGTGNNSISGTTSPAFNILEINKNTGNQLSLQNSISINSYINFLSGLIDLSGNNIVLNNTAYLNNENETTRITGTTGGYVQATATLNAPASANVGNLGILISTPENPGVTIIRRGHVSQQNSYGNGNTILRYYDILPTTTPASFNLRLKYFDAELNGLSEPDLTMVKSNNSLVWLQEGYTGRDASANYVEFNSITTYNLRWSLSSIGNVLPLELLSFGTVCKTGAVQIAWTTGGDFNSGIFEVQRTSDGIQWQTISTLAAGSGSHYTYTDKLTGTSSMYRLKISSEGRITYSSIKTPGCTLAGSDAIVYPNPAANYLQVQLNNLPDKDLVLLLYSNNGHLVQIKNIRMAASTEMHTLPLTDLPAGTYHLSIQSSGYKKTIPFVKQ